MLYTVCFVNRVKFAPANVALFTASTKDTTTNAIATKQNVSSCVANQKIHENSSFNDSASKQQLQPVVGENVKVNEPDKKDDVSWACLNCGQKNLSTRNTCWRCDYII